MTSTLPASSASRTRLRAALRRSASGRLASAAGSADPAPRKRADPQRRRGGPTSGPAPGTGRGQRATGVQRRREVRQFVRRSAKDAGPPATRRQCRQHGLGGGRGGLRQRGEDFEDVVRTLRRIVAGHDSARPRLHPFGRASFRVRRARPNPEGAGHPRPPRPLGANGRPRWRIGEKRDERHAGSSSDGVSASASNVARRTCASGS